MRGSIVGETHAVVRLKELTWVNGRCLHPYGLFAGLAALPLADALRLVERGSAKLPGEIRLSRLREAVEAAAAAA